MSKPIHAKPSLYALYFYELKEIALKYGYNLVLHGSLNRDLDLIAVPWQEEIGSDEEMIQEFANHLGGRISFKHTGKRYSYLPGGRKNYIILLVRYEKIRAYDENGQLLPITERCWEDQEYYLDISVTPFVKI